MFHFRNANTFTDKELLKMQLEMTKKEIATLEEIRSIAKEDARRFYQMFDHSNKNKRKCTFSFFFIGFYILKLFEIT